VVDWLLIFSVVPFGVFLLLLLGKKTSLLWTAGVTLLLVLLETLFFWQVGPSLALSSILKGTFIAFDIFVIILGAIFFLEILKSLGIMDGVSYHLESFSKDYRLQVILLAWFLENFIEGTAGFGTPAAIVAPLLIGLGLSPLTALAISLLGNSTAGAFGAAGTPIRAGFADLSGTSLPTYAAAINLVGFLVPVFMLWMAVASQKDKTKQFFEALPFALWCGGAFVISSLITVFIGQEFPSILGSLLGLGLVIVTTKLGFLIPKKVRVLEKNFEPEKRSKNQLSLKYIIFPYGLLIGLLILGKFLFGSLTIRITLPATLKHAFSLFNPGVIFMITGLTVALLWLREKNELFKITRVSFKRALEPFLVISCMSAMVQLMVNSGTNLANLSSSLEAIARYFETTALPFLAPFIGAFGSFITGSVTISNIMFGGFLNTAGKAFNFNTEKILALELVGAAAGNMIALADILAAEAVVGLKNQTREVLKKVIVPCLIYVTLTGLIGLIVFS